MRLRFEKIFLRKIFFCSKILNFRFPKVAQNPAGIGFPGVSELRGPVMSARFGESSIRRCVYIPSLSSNSSWRQSYVDFPAGLEPALQDNLPAAAGEQAGADCKAF